MYRDYYKLSAKPFRLTPDPAFVSAHPSYRKAQAKMQHALEQGDGILVVTGRAGTGKTTLIENFQARLEPGKVLCATVVGTSLETENLVRMVGYAFGLDARNLDQATLLCELQEFLTHQANARALLIIDEAHNLSSEAFEEVRTLLNMYAGSRPLLQIFLVGQEDLREKLQTPELQQLHQRIMAVCVLQPLSLQETHDYLLHRLHCAGWRGNPAFGIYTFVLVHRFSQGLPRYISKLCTRLLAHGAEQQRQRLNLDDVVAVIDEMQSELLLPLPGESQPGTDAPLPLIQDLLNSKALPDAQRVMPTLEERTFLESHPSVVQDTPASVVRAAQLASNAVITIAAEPEQPAEPGNANAGPNAADSSTPAPAWHGVQRYLGMMAQVLKSVALALGTGLRHLIAGMGELLRRSRGLKPVAQTLWIALKNVSAKAWALLAAGFSFCSVLLSRFAGRVGTRKLVGAASLLLVVVGAYLLSTDRGEQHRKAVASVASASLPASQNSEQAPAPAAEVTTAAATPGVTPPVPATELQVADNAVSQVAGSLVPQEAGNAMPPLADSSVVEAADSSSPQVPDSSASQEAGNSASQEAGSSESQAPVSSAPQVALGSPAAAASTAEPGQTPEQDPQPGKAATAPTAETEQHKVAQTDGAEAASGNSAKAARQARIEELLALADRAMARDRLRRPEKKSAWHYYSQVLDADPDNRAAQDGMRNIAARYHELAVIVLRRQEIDKAEGLIQRGLSVVVNDKALLALQGEVQRQREELRAAQEQEELLALRKTEPESPAPVVVEEPPKSGGLFGTLKRVFSGKKATQ